MKKGKFFVPQVMAPGIARHLVGFFKPGSLYYWPDGATPVDEKGEIEKNADGKDVEFPSLNLVPMDAEAYAILVNYYGADTVKARHGETFGNIPDEAPKKGGKKAAAWKGVGGGGGIPKGKVAPHPAEKGQDAGESKGKGKRAADQ